MIATKRLAKSFAKYWIAGTLATLFVAWLLWRRNEKELAVATVLISPFPFPGPEA